jgi:uncharacterized alpha-E superfamily protein
MTTLIPSTPPLDVNHPPRPMLSRDADSMYWLSRYIERAEHVARLLMVNSNLLMDVGDLAPHLQARQWRSILETMRLDELPPSRESLASRILLHMTFNADNPSSLVSCLNRARENARSIRENISGEMWESVNALYWSICAEDTRVRFEESAEEIFRSVMSGSMLFQGLTDQTLSHDQRWLFMQLGKYFERIDVTCRVIETKFNILRSAESKLEPALRNIHWMAVLRSCSSLETYQRSFVGDMEPMRVAGFLILQRSFPRSIRYCVEQAYECSAEMRAGISAAAIDPAERILGRLRAELEYAEMTEVLAVGLPAYLRRIQAEIADASMAVQRAYFLH